MHKCTGFHWAIPAMWGVSLGAAVQLGTVHLCRMGGLLFGWGRRVGAAQKALPHRFLRERLGATLADQTLHDLMLCAHGAKDSPASHLAVGSLCPITAVQTWRDEWTDKWWKMHCVILHMTPTIKSYIFCNREFYPCSPHLFLCGK